MRDAIGRSMIDQLVPTTFLPWSDFTVELLHVDGRRDVNEEAKGTRNAGTATRRRRQRWWGRWHDRRLGGGRSNPDTLARSTHTKATALKRLR